MSRNEPLKVRIYLCFWSFNEKNDFHRNRYLKTAWGKGGKGEIGLKVLQAIGITGSADEIFLQTNEERSRLKSLSAMLWCWKKSSWWKRKKKGNAAPSGSAVVLNGQLPARRNAPGWREVSDLYDKQHTVSQSAHSISVSKWNIDWKWPWNRMH